MANEAALRDRLAHPIDFTVADGTGIEKGAILALTDPRTAVAPTVLATQALAGIAAREKVASDGRTRLSIFTKGIFDMTASGAITVGNAVVSAHDANYPNTVAKALGLTNPASGAAILGYALETASDAEVIQIYVDVGAGRG